MSVDRKIINNIKVLTPTSKKVPVYMLLDSDVLSWFKSRGRGYQRFINDVLKAYKEASGGETDSSLVEYAQECFNEFYAQCFWHLRKDLKVTISEIPLIVDGLKKYGGREGYIKAGKLCQ